MEIKGYKSPKDVQYGDLKKGDTVSFLRQVVGHPTKRLTGKVVAFNFIHNLGIPRSYYPVVHVKADCEYGSALEYNHTLHTCELTKI